MICLVMIRYIPVFAFLALLTLPLAIKAFLVSKKNFDKIIELLPANAATIALHSLIGISLALSFVLDKIF